MLRSPVNVIEFKQLLESFLASKKHFQVIRSITNSNLANRPSTSPKTLLILDSSFNPPSIAHSYMVESAVAHAAQNFPSPPQVLFLFSVHNADKSPSPAAFENRLALMTLMAEDLWSKWENSEGAFADHKVRYEAIPPIDIAVTTQPFYNDKSLAIAESEVYHPDCTHVHLVGYDTFVRIFDAKYYKAFSPPLSALDGYFERHRFLVTLRPGGDWGGEDSQRKLWQDLESGSLENLGAKSAWADRIQMIPAEREEIGISSTKIRNAVANEDFAIIRELCTPQVSNWIIKNSPYG